MNRLLLLLGVIAATFFGLFWSGVGEDPNEADEAHNVAKSSLQQGNDLYEQADYAEALAAYTEGIAVSPENTALYFNAAQAAYKQGKLDTAVEYYRMSEDSIEKYLNSGNANFWLGEQAPTSEDNIENLGSGDDSFRFGGQGQVSADSIKEFLSSLGSSGVQLGDLMQDAPDMQMQYYIQARQTYETGMFQYPDNVPLKFNYEFVQHKIAELEEQRAQEEEQQEQSEERQEEREQNQNENSEQNNQNQSNTEQNQEAQADPVESQDQPPNQEDDGGGQDDLERLLELLEEQEEESLKNNQGVADVEEGKYGW